MTFKKGDKVKVVWNDNGDGKYEGTVTVIENCEGDYPYYYKLKGLGSCFRGEELRLAKKGTGMAKKFYRVKKDTFMWLEGAILEYDEDEGNGYGAINDLWDAVELDGEYITANIIEKNPDWFERVYEMSKAGKAVYVTKEKAREMASQFFSSGEEKK